jgi:hypothetical protein
MTRQRLAQTVVAAFGLFLACASGGHAGDVNYHGSLCNPATFASVNNIGYSQFGAHNESRLSPALVHCGGVHDPLNPITAVTVTVYDRHPAEEVTCTLVLVDLFGGTLFTETQSSVRAQSSFQQLEFSPGVAAATITLQCSIPQISPVSNEVSHLTTYTVTTP